MTIHRINKDGYRPVKLKPCKYCGFLGHTAMTCRKKPKKPLARVKRMRPEAVKTREKRIATNKAWDEANPPDEWGYWTCYLRIHPWCPVRIDRTMLNREHDMSKARSKKSEHDIKNIYPACGYCNSLKLSLTAEEAIKKYGQKEIRM